MGDKQRVLEYLLEEGPQANVQIQVGVDMREQIVNEILGALVMEGKIVRRELPDRLKQWQYFDDDGNPQLFWYEPIRTGDPPRRVYII